MVSYNLDSLRNKVDEIDSQLFNLLEERFKVSKLIGIYKKERGLKIEDKDRENDLMDKRKKLSNLPEDFVNKLFELILYESKKIQRAVRN